MPLPSKSYRSSPSHHIPQYKDRKIFVENFVPGRHRELMAQREMDSVALRIAEQSRYKNARRLVKLVDSTKQVPRLGGDQS